jgi:hypothetical protein
MPFPFLNLPGELRNAIYHQVFGSNPRNDASRFHHPLFTVNRQIRHESRSIYFSTFIFIRIETPWDATDKDGGNELLPILASGQLAAEFYNYHMSVVVEGPQHGVLDRESKKLLLLVEDLPKFCQLWFYWHLSMNAELNQDLGLTVELHNPLDETSLPEPVQKALLMPFGTIKDLSAVKVFGASEEIVQKMKDEMKVPSETPEWCLEEATRLKDLGNDALRNHNPQAAIDLYIQSFLAIHIVCVGHLRLVWGDPWFDRLLQGGQFDGQHGHIVRLILRIRLVANILKAYLDLKEYEEAWFWGERTISLMRKAMGNQNDEAFVNFPAAVETGKIYFRTGYAGKQIGKPEDEVTRMLKVAHTYLPRDPVIQRELG